MSLEINPTREKDAACVLAWWAAVRAASSGRCIASPRGLDDRFELVAAALSSDPARARAAALDLHIVPERAYGSFAEMASAEAKRKDRIDAVAIVTPNHLHYAPAKAFLEAGIHVICDKPLTTTLEDAQRTGPDRAPHRSALCRDAQLHRLSAGATGSPDGGRG